MGLLVKICGIASRTDAEAVARLRPDAMGFVFWAGSPRAVTPREVASWPLPPGILKVGVFVDAPPAEVARTVAAAGLDVAQLHGRETPADGVAVGGRVWKALRLGDPAMPSPDGYRVDAFLLDRYSPESPGGTGRRADWELARRLVETLAAPAILAGGLDPDNVQDAVRAVRPWGVDVSSGVEASPGRKDLGKVRRFIEQCRAL